MLITGKLLNVLPEVKGNGKNGNWIKKDIIIEIDDRYPKKICVSVWGEKIDLTPFKIGDILNVNVDIESKEYNNRWFTEVKAWKINKPEIIVPVNRESSENKSIQSNDDFDNTPF
jgi:hypothetical protein